MLPKLESHRGSSHGILVRHQVGHQEEVEEETGGRSRETGEERTLKQPNTSAHAWIDMEMTTQDET